MILQIYNKVNLSTNSFILQKQKYIHLRNLNQNPVHNVLYTYFKILNKFTIQKAIKIVLQR